jgi:hypothetical protein
MFLMQRMEVAMKPMTMKYGPKFSGNLALRFMLDWKGYTSLTVG